jgi:rhomboid protease GluP
MERSLKNSFYIFFKIHPVTTTILLINFMLFVVLLFYGGFNLENLVDFGAIFPPFILENGQWYRIITAIFLHGGFVHFLSNSIVLFFLGSHLERLIGSLRYIIIYMISGIVSSLFVVYFGGYTVVTIGASGSIFGIVGALLLLTFLRKTWFSEQSKRSIRQLVIINLVLTFAIPNISIPGHLGGLIAGVIFFYFFIPKTPVFQKKVQQLREAYYQSNLKDKKEDDDLWS